MGVGKSRRGLTGNRGAISSEELGCEGCEGLIFVTETARLSRDYVDPCSMLQS